MRRLLLFLFFSRMVLAQTVGTPAFKEGTGTYINSVLEVMTDTTAGTRFCYTLDGSTPTATVAGTCDVNGSIYSSTGAYAAIATSGTTLKVIGTKSGMSNSAVARATYTITSQPVANPIVFTTPVNITNAGANVVDELPFMIKVPNGDVFVFYSESTNGHTVDGGAPARIMFKKSTNSGTSWTSPTSVSCPAGDPATGCFYDDASSSKANYFGVAGVDYNGTIIVLMEQTSRGSVVGITEMRSTDNGATWTSPALLTTPSYVANQFNNPTANIVTISPGSAGVTGSCASGCSFVSVLAANGGVTGLIFTYDHGATWADPVALPAPSRNTWPYTTEERAIIWSGGMNLIVFSRPSNDISVSQGWPTAIMVTYSSNLGASWNSYLQSGLVTTQYGIPSNLPVSTCAVAPNTSWTDTFTRLSVVTDPMNPALSTLLYGERFTCSGVAKKRWQVVTFNSSSAFTNSGQNLPLPQILDLDPISTAQPHTTYSNLIPLGANTLLMAYEQGNTTSTEDIYTTILSYVNPSMSGVSPAQRTKK